MTPTLSLVMATLNRGAFIGETIASILPQLGPQCELVILDGASADNTQAIVEAFVALSPHLRYIRADVNSGVDRDYDLAVGHARGHYCWLVSDDDLLCEGAVQRVIGVLDRSPDVVVVDSEVRDIALSRVIAPRRMKFSGERTYGIEKTDELLRDAGEALSFIGGTIVKTALWRARDRESYYGSLFVHMGVIFQAPVNAIVLGEPLVIIRLGNAGWSGRAFEIWMFKYPALVWKFAASDASKQAVTPREPWRHLKHLMSFRAKGAYSIAEYRKYFGDVDGGLFKLVLLLVAVAPGRPLNCLALLAHWISGQHRGIGAYLLAHNNRFSNPVGRWIAS